MEEAGSNEHPAKKQRVETGGDGDGMEVSAAAPSAPPPAALSPEEKLLRQLEYYFSDAAFPFDNFLLEQRDADGAISAATLASFPKVVALTASLSQTEREQALCNAAAASDSVYALDGGRIARRFPLPGEDPTAARSVCLEGMPRATDQTAVESLLRDAGADPLSFRRLRNVHDRSFSGQYFVELVSEEQAVAMVGAAREGKLILGERRVRARLLSDHFERQANAIRANRQKQEEAKAAKASRSAREHGKVLRFEGARAGMTLQEVQAFCTRHAEVALVDLREGGSGYVRFRETAGALAVLAAAAASESGEGREAVEGGEMAGGEGDMEMGGAEGGAEGGGPPILATSLRWQLLSNDRVDAYWQEVQELKRERESQGTRLAESGIVLHFEGVGAEADREAIKTLAGQHADVAFVDYRRGEPAGFVRFRSASGASAALAALEAAAEEVGGSAPAWRLLGIEEEAEYKAAVLERNRGGKGGKGGKGKGGGKGWGRGKGRGKGWGKGGGKGGKGGRGQKTRLDIS